MIQLADGSHVKLAPSTEGRLDEQRRFKVKATAAAVDDGLVAATLRLLSGRVEVFASKVLRARPLEVSTPTAVIGVRGTVYRVRNDVTPAAGGRERGQHVGHRGARRQGARAGRRRRRTQSADVPAKFGAPLEAGKKPVVLPLPPAPDLSGVPALFDQLPIRLTCRGTLPLRVQVANDAAFDHIQLDLHVAAGDDVRIPRLADGAGTCACAPSAPKASKAWTRVRDFQLRARPESPFLVEPPANAKRRSATSRCAGRTTPTPRATSCEVARDAQFTQLALRDEQVRGEQARVPSGRLRLRRRRRRVLVARGERRRRRPPRRLGRHAGDDPAPDAARAAGPREPGRLGASSSAGAAAPKTAPRSNWRATPRSSRSSPAATSAPPGGKLARQSAGTYCAHYRFVEPDGFKTAWSGAVKIAVESNWHEAWRALLPDAWFN